MISCRLRPLIVLLVLAATPPIVAQPKKLAAEEGPAARSERLSELIGYNLACALTMKGGLDPALDELDLLVGKGPHLESAAKDPQLAALREGEPGVRFQAMLERDRATRNG